MSRKYLLPLPRTAPGRGQQKIEDVPPYCTRTLYTGPPGPGRRDAWHILGSLLRGGRGDCGSTRERGPPGGRSGPGYWSWHFLVLGSFLVLPAALVPYLAQLPAPSWPQRAPLAPGGSVLPSQPGGPEGRLWLHRGSPAALSLVFTQGEGCVWQKQLYKCGCGASPPGSLGQFADDADQGRVLVLEALVVSPEVG